MRHWTLGTMLRPLTLLAIIGLATACGDDDADTSPDTGAPDAGGDTDVDTDAPDTSADAEPTPDATPDVAPDTGTDPDAEPDVAPDVEPDAAPDVEPDAIPDADPDVTPDADPDADPVEVDPIDIEGVWQDNFGGSHWITELQWQSGWGPFAGRFAIATWNREANWLVAQNAPTNAWSPDLWSRYEWAIDDEDRVRFCQSVFDGESEDAATVAPRADANDFAEGCNGFSWSILTPGQGPVAIIGGWVDTFGGTFFVEEDRIEVGYEGSDPSIFAVTAWSNVDQWIVAQNEDDNEFFPSLWSRFDWTWDEEGDLFYCQTRFDAENEAEALVSPAADTDDLAAGCAGFPWSGVALP